ncbi:MAG: hypothetical protein ACO3L8_01395 [Ilumatobacteraceae bacterium]
MIATAAESPLRGRRTRGPLGLMVRLVGVVIALGVALVAPR